MFFREGNICIWHLEHHILINMPTSRLSGGVLVLLVLDLCMGIAHRLLRRPISEDGISITTPWPRNDYWIMIKKSAIMVLFWNQERRS